MARTKKASPNKGKVALPKNVTNRKLLRGATSTPLSKGKLAVGVNSVSPNADENTVLEKSKNESILETPKRASSRGAYKRTGSVLNEVEDGASSKKRSKNVETPKKVAKEKLTTKSSTGLEAGTVNGRDGKTPGNKIGAKAKKATKTIEIASDDLSKTNHKPSTLKKRGRPTKNKIVEKQSSVKAKIAQKSPKKTKPVKKSVGARKSIGVQRSSRRVK